MFYHVVIEIEGNKEPIYELDRTIESVIEEVMIPYLEGKSFHFDGYPLALDRIKRINIKRLIKQLQNLQILKMNI